MAFFVNLKYNLMKKLFFALLIALSTATVAQAQTKIAHVNSQTLLDTLPSRKKAIAEIQAFSARADQELKDMETKLQKEVDIFLAGKATSTPTMIAYDETRLTKMQNDIQYREQEINALLQKMSQELNEEILKTVTEAVEIIAKRKGLNYIIDKSSTLYAGGTDVTNEVIPELLKIDTAKTAANKAVGGQ